MIAASLTPEETSAAGMLPHERSQTKTAYALNRCTPQTPACLTRCACASEGCAAIDWYVGTSRATQQTTGCLGRR